MIQGGNQGGRFPVTLWHVIVNPLATKRTAAKTRHVGFGPRLVNENELFRIEAGLSCFPEGPFFGDIGTILLAGPQRFFCK